MNNSENLDIFSVFLKILVSIPAIMNIVPCPIEKDNNITVDTKMLLDTEANPIIPARIGVEHGEPANANTIPNIMGYKYRELFLLAGILLINDGIVISNNPNMLRPITMSSDAIITTKYPPINDKNIFPLMAQMIPNKQ